MLKLERFSCTFGNKLALDAIDLIIEPGEKVAIIGRSGSGKTTLINQINAQLHDRAAFCSQQQGLVDSLSVFHNIFMGALGRHHFLYNLLNLAYPFKRPLQDITAIIGSLELDCPVSQPVSRLSGGQRQRTAVGRALYQNMPVFIGDEPFSALDPMMSSRLITLLMAQHNTVIMVLHDVNMALTHFDRIIGLCEGKKVIDAAADTLNSDLLQAFYHCTADAVISPAQTPTQDGV
ncbi:ATP-binding cassette domain-containing protein [Shewanella sp.]|nr:ATP-binding cassette domain-containing protein [Shewanella sp.]